jgi:hypothetical protein
MFCARKYHIPDKIRNSFSIRPLLHASILRRGSIWQTSYPVYVTCFDMA